MGVDASLKGFAITALILEVFFAIIYSLTQSYSANLGASDFNGLIVTIFLCFLILIGFGLITTYLKNFSIGGLTLTFIIVAFTVQWYFLMRNFWVSVRLYDNTNTYPQLGWYTNFIKLNNDSSRYMNVATTEATLADALACALAMYVALFPSFGRVGPFETLILCFVGNFAYTLLDGLFYRLFISDNGYGSRIFLFASVMGIVTSLLLGKKELTQKHPNYYSRYHFQLLGLLGSVFVWILLPWLSAIGQGTNNSIVNFNQIAPLNIWYALSASACASFCCSIWINGKISVHDIVFSSFSGAVAYGASSNVFPHPWPSILIGFLTGLIVTALNSTKKKSLNANGVIDSLGSIYLFLIPSFIGGIYSAILYASGAFGADYSGANAQVDSTKSRYTIGGYQLAGMALAIGIGAFAGLLIGLFFKLANKNDGQGQFFDDSVYLEKDEEIVLKKSKVVV